MIRIRLEILMKCGIKWWVVLERSLKMCSKSPRERTGIHRRRPLWWNINFETHLMRRKNIVYEMNGN